MQMQRPDRNDKLRLCGHHHLCGYNYRGETGKRINLSAEESEVSSRRSCCSRERHQNGLWLPAKLGLSTRRIWHKQTVSHFFKMPHDSAVHVTQQVAVTLLLGPAGPFPHGSFAPGFVLLGSGFPPVSHSIMAHLCISRAHWLFFDLSQTCFAAKR